MNVPITILRASVLADMKVKNHAEAALIVDNKERYLVEAGSEKTQELHQCITDAFADVTALMRPFLYNVTISPSNTTTDAFVSTGDLNATINVTSRKAAGIEKPLANALHKYVVDSALAKFYKAVAHPALAQSREAALAGDAAAIENLLYRRKDPTYTSGD